MPAAEIVGTIPTGCLAAFYIAILSLHFMDLGVKRNISLLGKIFKSKMSLREAKHLSCAPCFCKEKMKFVGRVCQNRLQLDQKYYRWVTEIYSYQ